jgi:metal-dependent amidase/aminoacylase/carboxypeptidase family protein
MSGIDEILAGYENLRPGQEDFYRYLHQHPELSHQEHQTARRVAERCPSTTPAGTTCTWPA